MQVHSLAVAAPELAQQGSKNSGFCMQNHAAQVCMVIFCEIVGFFGDFYADVLRVCCACLRRKIWHCSGEYFA